MNVSIYPRRAAKNTNKVRETGKNQDQFTLVVPPSGHNNGLRTAENDPPGGGETFPSERTAVSQKAEGARDGFKCLGTARRTSCGDPVRARNNLEELMERTTTAQKAAQQTTKTQDGHHEILPGRKISILSKMLAESLDHCQTYVSRWKVERGAE